MRKGTKWLAIVACVTVAGLLIALPATAADITHRYDFENEDGTDSVGSLDGLVEGFPFFPDDAPSGNHSIELTGGQYVRFDDPMDFGDEFSIALWVLPDTSALGIQNLIGNGPGGWDQDGWKLYYNTWSDPPTADGALSLETGDGQNVGSPGDRVFTDPDTIFEEVWYHVVNTIDVGTGEVAMYVDGEPLSTSGGLNVDMKTDSPFEIGRMLGGWDLHGMMDDVQIYTGLITDEEAAWLYEHPGSVLGEAAPTMLQAGDADQNLEFNQLDLVKVQVAAKYLTGQPATWGEGDWNGAPGGEVGNPPAGDNLFNQQDIIAALAADIYLTGPYAAILQNGERNDEQTSVVYNVNTGEVAVDAPAGVELTSINIDSAAGIFTGDAAQNLGGSFDHDADNNIFKATFGGSFGSLSFGAVAQTGLSKEFVADDLTVVGSLAGGGDLGSVDLIYVPEPSTAVLLALGLLMGIGRIRKSR